MSPALLNKYLQAAREVANHLVLKPDGLAFAPHPMLVETDRDKYCVKQIIDFYQRQPTDYADYFQAAWRFKHRAALGQPRGHAGRRRRRQQGQPEVSGDGLAHARGTTRDGRALARSCRRCGARCRRRRGDRAELARAGCEQMRDYVVAAAQEDRAALRRTSPCRACSAHRAAVPDVEEPAVRDAPHDLRPRRAAGRRRSAAGRTTAPTTPRRRRRDDEVGAGRTRRDATSRRRSRPASCPPAERARYEAAFARFCRRVPRRLLHVRSAAATTSTRRKDKGRYLSAGFHNLMGYFRDDQPLYELILDEKRQKELDALWHELDFIASATHPHLRAVLLQRERRGARHAAASPTAPRPADKDDHLRGDDPEGRGELPGQGARRAATTIAHARRSRSTSTA